MICSNKVVALVLLADVGTCLSKSDKSLSSFIRAG